MKLEKAFAASNRPASGRLLWSHTLACFLLLGLWTKSGAASRTGVKVGTLKMLIGATAISHHSKKGNFERTDAGLIRLTPAGASYFSGRAGLFKSDVRADQSCDPQVVDAMLEALKHGSTVQGVKFDSEIGFTS